MSQRGSDSDSEAGDYVIQQALPQAQVQPQLYQGEFVIQDRENFVYDIMGYKHQLGAFRPHNFDAVYFKNHFKFLIFQDLSLNINKLRQIIELSLEQIQYNFKSEYLNIRQFSDDLDERRVQVEQELEALQPYVMLEAAMNILIQSKQDFPTFLALAKQSQDIYNTVSSFQIVETIFKEEEMEHNFDKTLQDLWVELNRFDNLQTKDFNIMKYEIDDLNDQFEDACQRFDWTTAYELICLVRHSLLEQFIYQQIGVLKDEARLPFLPSPKTPDGYVIDNQRMQIIIWDFSAGYDQKVYLHKTNKYYEEMVQLKRRGYEVKFYTIYANLEFLRQNTQSPVNMNLYYSCLNQKNKMPKIIVFDAQDVKIQKAKKIVNLFNQHMKKVFNLETINQTQERIKKSFNDQNLREIYSFYDNLAPQDAFLPHDPKWDEKIVMQKTIEAINKNQPPVIQDVTQTIKTQKPKPAYILPFKNKSYNKIHFSKVENIQQHIDMYQLLPQKFQTYVYKDQQNYGEYSYNEINLKLFNLPLSFQLPKEDAEKVCVNKMDIKNQAYSEFSMKQAESFREFQKTITYMLSAQLNYHSLSQIIFLRRSDQIDEYMQLYKISTNLKQQIWKLAENLDLNLSHIHNLLILNNAGLYDTINLYQQVSEHLLFFAQLKGRVDRFRVQFLDKDSFMIVAPPKYKGASPSFKLFTYNVLKQLHDPENTDFILKIENEEKGLYEFPWRQISLELCNHFQSLWGNLTSITQAYSRNLNLFDISSLRPIDENWILLRRDAEYYGAEHKLRPILNQIQIFILHLSLIQIDDVGLSEVLRAFKYITQIASAFKSDLAGLLQKKVFDSLFLRHSMSHFIIVELIKYATRIVKQRNIVLRKQKIVDAYQNQTNAIQLIQAKPPFYLFSDILKMDRLLDTMGLVSNIAKNIGNHDTKLLHVVKSIFKPLIKRDKQLHEGFEEDFTLLRKAGEQSKITVNLKHYMENKSDYLYHFDLQFSYLVSQQAVEDQNIDFDNLIQNIYSKLYKNLDFREITQHGIRTVKSNSLIRQTVAERFIEHAFRYNSEDVFQVFKEMLMNDDGKVKIGVSQKGDNRNECREVMVAQDYFRILHHFFNIIQKEINKQFIEENLKNENNAHVINFQKIMNSARTNLNKFQAKHRGGMYVMLNQDMSKFTSAMNKDNYLAKSIPLLIKLGPIGEFIHYFSQLNFDKYYEVPRQFWRRYYSKQPTQQQMDDLMRSDEITRQQLIEKNIVEGLVRQKKYTAHEMVSSEGEIRRIPNTQAFSRARFIAQKHIEQEKFDGLFDIYSSFWQDNTMGCVKVDHQQPQGFMSFLTSLHQVFVHRFRDKILAEQFNVSPQGFMDNHDDHTAVFHSTFKGMKSLDRVMWLTHFLYGGNINPQKSALSPFAEFLSIVHDGFKIHYPLTKFVLTDAPIVQDFAHSISQCRSIIQSGMNQGFYLETALAKYSGYIHDLARFWNIQTEKDEFLNLPIHLGGCNDFNQILISIMPNQERLTYSNLSQKDRFFEQWNFVAHRSRIIDNDVFLSPFDTTRMDIDFQKYKKNILKNIKINFKEVKEYLCKYQDEMACPYLIRSLNPQDVKLFLVAYLFSNAFKNTIISDKANYVGSMVQRKNQAIYKIQDDVQTDFPNFTEREINKFNRWDRYFSRDNIPENYIDIITTTKNETFKRELQDFTKYKAVVQRSMDLRQLVISSQNFHTPNKIDIALSQEEKTLLSYKHNDIRWGKHQKFQIQNFVSARLSMQSPIQFRCNPEEIKLFRKYPQYRELIKFEQPTIELETGFVMRNLHNIQNFKDNEVLQIRSFQSQFKATKAQRVQRYSTYGVEQLLTLISKDQIQQNLVIQHSTQQDLNKFYPVEDIFMMYESLFHFLILSHLRDCKERFDKNQITDQIGFDQAKRSWPKDLVQFTDIFNLIFKQVIEPQPEMVKQTISRYLVGNTLYKYCQINSEKGYLKNDREVAAVNYGYFYDTDQKKDDEYSTRQREYQEIIQNEYNYLWSIVDIIENGSVLIRFMYDKKGIQDEKFKILTKTKKLSTIEPYLRLMMARYNPQLQNSFQTFKGGKKHHDVQEYLIYRDTELGSSYQWTRNPANNKLLSIYLVNEIRNLDLPIEDRSFEIGFNQLVYYNNELLGRFQQVTYGQARDAILNMMSPDYNTQQKVTPFWASALTKYDHFLDENDPTHLILKETKRHVQPYKLNHEKQDFEFILSKKLLNSYGLELDFLDNMMHALPKVRGDQNVKDQYEEVDLEELKEIDQEQIELIQKLDNIQMDDYQTAQKYKGLENIKTELEEYFGVEDLYQFLERKDFSQQDAKKFRDLPGECSPGFGEIFIPEIFQQQINFIRKHYPQAFEMDDEEVLEFFEDICMDDEDDFVETKLKEYYTLAEDFLHKHNAMHIPDDEFYVRRLRETPESLIQKKMIYEALKDVELKDSDQILFQKLVNDIEFKENEKKKKEDEADKINLALVNELVGDGGQFAYNEQFQDDEIITDQKETQIDVKIGDVDLLNTLFVDTLTKIDDYLIVAPQDVELKGSYNSRGQPIELQDIKIKEEKVNITSRIEKTKKSFYRKYFMNNQEITKITVFYSVKPKVKHLNTSEIKNLMKEKKQQKNAQNKGNLKDKLGKMQLLQKSKPLNQTQEQQNKKQQAEIVLDDEPPLRDAEQSSIDPCQFKANLRYLYLILKN